MIDWHAIAPGTLHGDAAADLLDHYAVQRGGSLETLLEDVASVFSHLPYENLTKLLRKYQAQGTDRLRLPARVVSEHLKLGAGGTCFSLSALFGRALDLFDVAVYPVLAEMRSKRALHCGLVVPVGRERFLVDPGYLVTRPVRLVSRGVSRVEMETGVIEVRGLPDGRTYELWAGGKWRYRFSDQSIETARFLELWQESFDWVMMHQVHLSRATDGGYLYLHGHRMRIQQRDGKRNLNVRQRRVEALGEYFGIHETLARSALDVIDQARAQGRARDDRIVSPLAQREGRVIES